jgi:hypothetical protein
VVRGRCLPEGLSRAVPDRPARRALAGGLARGGKDRLHGRARRRRRRRSIPAGVARRFAAGAGISGLATGRHLGRQFVGGFRMAPAARTHQRRRTSRTDGRTRDHPVARIASAR